MGEDDGSTHSTPWRYKAELHLGSLSAVNPASRPAQSRRLYLSHPTNAHQMRERMRRQHGHSRKNRHFGAQVTWVQILWSHLLDV